MRELIFVPHDILVFLDRFTLPSKAWHYKPKPENGHGNTP